MSAVMFLDLDRLKFINDTLGRDIGDALSSSIGKRLCHGIREHDVVARGDGDEFIIGGRAIFRTICVIPHLCTKAMPSIAA